MMKFKRFCAGLAALCMVCAVVPVLPVQESAVISANAEECTYKNFKYSRYKEYVAITGYVEEPTGELVIPAEIDGFPVERVDNMIFADCQQITDLILPDTLTRYLCGYFCTDKSAKTQNKRISYPEHLGGAKEFHVSETHPTFSSKDGILFSKDGTELICYPSGKSDESYTIPDNVTKISTGAFAGCANLKSITIPDNVTEIDSSAFSECTELKTIIFPEKLPSIGNNAFKNTLWQNEQLKNSPFVIVNNVLIDGKACTGDVTIPKNVTKIENGAFWCSSNLTSIIIPDGVTSIESYAFTYCSALASVTIPKSVTSIGNMAFNSCSSLSSITIENPDCIIEDYGNYKYGSTISHGWNNETQKYEFAGTIYGYNGSTAQAYAEENGYKFALIGSAPDTTEPKTEELKQGDADGSGEVDILDVITINKAIMGKENLSENGLKAIDFNGNGKPDPDEALTLLKYIVGLITDFHA